MQGMFKNISNIVLPLNFITLFTSKGYSDRPLQGSGNVKEVMETAAIITGEQDLIRKLKNPKIKLIAQKIIFQAALTRSPLNQGADDEQS